MCGQSLDFDSAVEEMDRKKKATVQRPGWYVSDKEMRRSMSMSCQCVRGPLLSCLTIGSFTERCLKDSVKWEIYLPSCNPENLPRKGKF